MAVITKQSLVLSRYAIQLPLSPCPLGQHDQHVWPRNPHFQSCTHPISYYNPPGYISTQPLVVIHVLSLRCRRTLFRPRPSHHSLSN